jgi:hypothetical protein
MPHQPRGLSQIQHLKVVQLINNTCFIDGKDTSVSTHGTSRVSLLAEFC